MFKNTESYIFFNKDKIPSKNGVIVLYRTEIQAEKVQPGKFLAGTFMAFSLVFLSLQTGWVYNAKAEGNLVTSPVTSEENPSPSVSPSDNPITSPEESPSATPSPSTQPPSNPSSGGSGNSNGVNSGSGNSGGGSVSAPSCNNEVPKSAPKIISAVTTGKNEITLIWEKAKGPVTHYVIAYGLQKGRPLYGNPDVGNVTSYAVKGLSGGLTYYFKVRAGNDCQPGAYSEEVGVKVGGKFIKAPAQGFKAGVLGKTVKVKKQNKPALVKPVVFNNSVIEKKPNAGLAGKVISFFKGLFN